MATQARSVADARPAPGAVARLRAALPRGNTLPADAWLRRHTALVVLVALQAPALAVYGLLQGFGVGHSVLEGGVLLALAAAAWGLRARRRIAAIVCSLGLISSSALFVHLANGLIEAHFHFFVMILLLTLYEDWAPFLLAGAYVVLHHGIIGAADPGSVYSHADAIAEPWKWAGIHALFVVAAGFAGVVAWRLNEEARAESDAACTRAHESERSLLETQELAMVGGFEYDVRSGEVTWSEQLYQLFGVDPKGFQPSFEAYMSLVHPNDRPRVQAGVEEAFANRSEFSHQYRILHPSGDHRVFHARGIAIAGDDGAGQRLIGTCQDVTQRNLTETRAARRAEAQEAVAALGERALGITDLNGLFKEAITTIARVLAVEMASVAEWIPDEDEFVIRAETGLEGAAGYRYRAGFASQGGFTLLAGKPVVVDDWEGEERFEAPEIIRRHSIRSSATVILQRREVPFGVLGAHSHHSHEFEADEINFLQAVANLISAAIDRLEAEEEIRHRALHDPLTGLPNRVLFADRLAQALAHARRDKRRVAVLFCDLDQFKLVNDSLGHAAGDELLTSVAPRLTRTLRAGDSVARFGGDEFAILVEGVDTERDATRAAERVGAALASPFVVRGRELFVTATIGIAIGDGTESPEALIRDSDLAMYRAKEGGRGRYEIFDEVMRARAIEHLRIETDLRRALERGELALHFQPVISLASGAITSVESLVRWHHPDRGLIMPGDFIPLAEESGLIVELGDQVIDMACRQAAEWQRERPDGPPIGISVNASARQLADPGLPDRIRRVLLETDLQPLCLSLEVTEGTLLDETEIPAETFTRLKELGVGLVLDDFGTGFSSLGYLHRFPFDTLKIDRSFIERLPTEATDAAIVNGVTGIAAALGLAVVAEGVETQEQLEAVISLGCQYAQGYLFARPVTAEKAGELLRAPTLAWAERLTRV